MNTEQTSKNIFMYICTGSLKKNNHEQLQFITIYIYTSETHSEPIQTSQMEPTARINLQA